MKTLITTGAILITLSGCSSLPSYQEMSCTELLKEERSLQQDYKVNSVGSIVAGIADIVEDSTKSTADSVAADVDLEATKRDLRIVQAEIHKRRCKK